MLIAAAFGACIGSFLGVVLWRVPRGESIVRPPSHCGNCGHDLRPRELIPVVSYVVQQGRCRECGAEIPASALLIEIGCALVFAVIALVLVG
jgi:leader peptidase (prepilin peptidase)/N-methyltransferase